ncbi:MAG: hypothetical protein WCH40_09730 [Verrucomicrobiales bacterium]
MMIVTKEDGATLAGAPEAEAADSITILQPDGKEIVVSKADIGSQTLAISVMPPMGEILKPAELRDLVEHFGTHQ